jgi:hypothetical protein
MHGIHHQVSVKKALQDNCVNADSTQNGMT